MATSTIKMRGIASVDCTIANNTDPQEFDLPSGFTKLNCTLIGARCYTRYNTWVDHTYANGVYFGDLIYKPSENTQFIFTPNTAGNTTKIIFTFAIT